MDVLFYLLKSAAILAIFYIVYVVLLRKETHFKAHRLYLLLGVIGSFLLPFQYFSKTVIVDVAAYSGSSFSSSEIIPASTESVVQTATAIDWWQIVLILYISGVAIVFLRFLKQLVSLLTLLNGKISNRNNGFRYIQVSENIAPFSFFSYIVYNPLLHSEEELKMILKHEQAHAFQWHSADIIISNIMVMLQWPNPFAWLYKKSVEENLEFLADNATAAEVPSKKEYQLALVKASSAYYTPALTTNFYKSFIKKRIIMLNKRTSKRHHLLKLAAVLPFIAFFLWSFNVKETISYNELPVIPEIDQKAVTMPPAEKEITEVPKKEKEKIAAISSKTENKQITENVLALEPDAVIESIDQPVLAIVYSQSQDFKFKITKNTTDAEMKKIKDDLMKNHKIDLSYDIVRNNSKEIVSISLQYTGENRSGNYNINDDKGIEDFYFYMEEGESGFWSERAEERRVERDNRRATRMNNNQDRREEIIVEREAMRNELAEKRKVLRDEMREKRKEMIVERKVHKDLLRKENELAKRYELIRSGDGDDEDDIFVIRDDADGELFEYKYKKNNDEHTIMIDKDTSDSSLAKTKERLSKKGIDFSYKKIKRNSKGEITRIHITVNSNNGSKQTIDAKADDGDPIDELLIIID